MRFLFTIALSLFAISVSAFDTDTFIATLKERQLAEGDISDMVCLMASSSSIIASLSPITSLLMGSDLNGTCQDGLSTCDVGASDFATQVKVDCDNNNGKVFVENICLDQDTIESIKDAVPATVGTLEPVDEISITGIPLCLASTCRDALDVFGTLRRLLPLIINSGSVPDDLTGILPGVLSGDCSKKSASNKSTANPGRLTAFAGALVLGMTYSIM